MFKGKRVAILGGSDCAIISALYLVQICKEVYLIHRRNEFRAEEANQEKLRKSKIKLIMNSVVEKIEGNKTIENLKIKNVETNEISDLKVGGVFVEIGQIPTSQIAKKAGVNVDENGFIKVNSKQETNLKGVYAAGDITGGFAQIITAVGQGAVATMSAYLCIHGPAYTGRVDWGEKKRKTCS
jgi:thioredoxin reductase (NADPH)